jgi:hypothetical protein
VAQIITLLTDFGVESTYPAQMKGVILGLCPTAAIVDLSHGVPRHDVRTAAFMLGSTVQAFPLGTIHVAVVDPQVGSTRRALAAEACGHVYLAPDNGLLTLVTHGQALFGQQCPPARVFAIENRSLMRAGGSSTFHGRDVFAPVAAALACGTPIQQLGPEIESINEFSLPLPTQEGAVIRGQILYVDPFGNLVSNIAARSLQTHDPAGVRIQVGGGLIRGLSRSYSDVPAGVLLAYLGSAGLLEVAVNRQSAASRLGAAVGTHVTVRMPATPETGTP